MINYFQINFGILGHHFFHFTITFLKLWSSRNDLWTLKHKPDNPSAWGRENKGHIFDFWVNYSSEKKKTPPSCWRIWLESSFCFVFSDKVSAAGSSRCTYAARGLATVCCDMSFSLLPPGRSPVTSRAPDRAGHKMTPCPLHLLLLLLLPMRPGRSTKSHAVTQRSHCISPCPLCFDHCIHYSSGKVCTDPAQHPGAKLTCLHLLHHSLPLPLPRSLSLSGLSF